MTFWVRPHATRLRRVAFQLHLWAGVVLGLYVFVIGATGAVLMFRSELQALVYPEVFRPADAGGQVAGIDTVLAAAAAAYPRAEISGFDFPNARRGTFLAYVVEAGRFRTVFLHPSSGRVMGEVPADGWIQRLQQLHFDLLAGSTGQAVSRVGAWGLLALAISGPVLWWPGRATWRSGFVVARRAGWKRTMWELHRATGIWVLVLVAMWAMTGIHFMTPGLARRVVGAVAPLATPAPVVHADSTGAARVPLLTLIDEAQARWPGASVARVLLATRPGGAAGVTIARVRHGDWDTSEEVTLWFDPASGRLLRTDEASRAPAGETAIRWLGLLHVGNFGGRPLQILWAAGGLALCALFVTGYVMWWNRVRLRAMTRPRRLAVLVVIVSGLSLACSAPAASEEEIVAPLTAFYGAMKTGDKAAAMKPIAADAVFAESGKLETRAEYEMNHLPADIDFERQITGKRSPWQVTTHGDTAWVIATTEYDGTVDNRPVNFVSAQLAVLTRQTGDWQIRSIHWSSRRR